MDENERKIRAAGQDDYLNPKQRAVLAHRGYLKPEDMVNLKMYNSGPNAGKSGKEKKLKYIKKAMARKKWEGGD
jgi:hypothetical protein